MQGDKLIQAIKGMVSSPVNNFIYGVVTSIEPIKILVEGLPELQPTQIILSDRVKEKIIKIPNEDTPQHKHKVNTLTTSQGGDPPHSHTVEAFETLESLPEIKLWDGLKVGDKVFIIRSNNGQSFYVMEVIKDDTD